MTHARLALLWRQIDDAETGLCRRWGRLGQRPAVRHVFATVSRLGDGVFWYSLIAVMPFLYGETGLASALRMLACGAVGLGVYRVLKEALVRERPCVRHPDLRAGVAPLDRFGFPSGHTLHAVGFTTVAVGGFPELGWVLVPFAALVAASRVVLGLHYPTDVLAGAVLGYALAQATLALPI